MLSPADSTYASASRTMVFSFSCSCAADDLGAYSKKSKVQAIFENNFTDDNKSSPLDHKYAAETQHAAQKLIH
jgi:hypothetical protein